MGLAIAMDAVNRRRKVRFSITATHARGRIICHFIGTRIYTQVRTNASTQNSAKTAVNTTYNPFLVDDPDFQTGRNKIVITLPCFKGSIIQHSKASDVNKAQNEYLKERLPGLDANITLAEIRDLKSKMIEVGMAQDLEISSVASAFVYFEKLLVKVWT